MINLLLLLLWCNIFIIPLSNEYLNDECKFKIKLNKIFKKINK